MLKNTISQYLTWDKENIYYLGKELFSYSSFLNSIKATDLEITSESENYGGIFENRKFRSLVVSNLLGKVKVNLKSSASPIIGDIPDDLFYNIILKKSKVSKLPDSLLPSLEYYILKNIPIEECNTLLAFRTLGNMLSRGFKVISDIKGVGDYNYNGIYDLNPDIIDMSIKNIHNINLYPLMSDLGLNLDKFKKKDPVIIYTLMNERLAYSLLDYIDSDNKTIITCLNK